MAATEPADVKQSRITRELNIQKADQAAQEKAQQAKDAVAMQAEEAQRLQKVEAKLDSNKD